MQSNLIIKSKFKNVFYICILIFCLSEFMSNPIFIEFSDTIVNYIVNFLHKYY